MYKLSEHKKSLFLLLLSVYYYHGIENEDNDVIQLSQSIDGYSELAFAKEFVSIDVLSCFERSIELINSLLIQESDKMKLHILFDVWSLTSQKGYMTEVEVNAMLKLARGWTLETDFIEKVKQFK